MTQEQIYELLHSTETSRVERTVSTGDMDKFQETAEIQEIEKAIKEDSDKMSKLMSKLIPSHFQVEEQKKLELLIKSLGQPKKASELAAILSCSDCQVKRRYLNKLVNTGVVKQTIPDKPTSSNQQYILADDSAD